MAVPKTGFLGLFKPLLNQFSKWGQYYNDNWDLLDAALSLIGGQFQAEHKTTGEHGDIHCDSIMVNGVPLGAIDSGVATSVGALAINDTSKDWSPNAFDAGIRVGYLTGGKVTAAKVGSNTATQIVLVAGSKAPDADTTYKLYGAGDPTLPQMIENSDPGEAAIEQNLLPANFAKVLSKFDNLYDIGTLAVPVVSGVNTALISGGSLLPNGGFDDGAGGGTTTGWAANGVGSPSIDAVADGALGSGFAMEVTCDGGSDNGEEVYTSLTVGRRYQVSIKNKHGTCTAGSILVGPTRTDGVYYKALALTDAGWTTHTFSFVATSNVVYFNLTANGAGTELFSEVTLNEVTPGNTSANTDAMDGWNKNGSVTPHIFQVIDDATHCKGRHGIMMVNSAGATWSTIYNKNRNENWYKQFLGETVTIGCYAYTDTAANFRIGLGDGVTGNLYSSYIAAGVLKWVELPYDVAANATDLQILLDARGAAGGISWISRPMLVRGSSIGEGNYVPPSEAWVTVDKDGGIPLNTLNNKTGASGFSDVAATLLNLQADTDGAIPSGIKGFRWSAMAKDSASASTDYCGLTLDKQNSVHNASNLGIAGVANDMTVIGSGEVDCDDDGNIYYGIQASGANTFDVPQFRIQAVRLR